MASISLGLESLKNTQHQASESELLVNYYAALNQFSDAVYEFKDLCTTSESLRSIRSCIRQYGVTQSLESLFGENFSSAAAMEEEAAAAEQKVEAKKAGFFQRLIDLVKRLYNSLIALVKKGWAFITRAKYAGPVAVKAEATEPAAEPEVKQNNTEKTIVVSEAKFEAMKGEFKKQIADLGKEQKALLKKLEDRKSSIANPTANDVTIEVQIKADIENYKMRIKTAKAQYNMLLKCAKIAENEKQKNNAK